MHGLFTKQPASQVPYRIKCDLISKKTDPHVPNIWAPWASDRAFESRNAPFIPRSACAQNLGSRRLFFEQCGAARFLGFEVYSVPSRRLL